MGHSEQILRQTELQYGVCKPEVYINLLVKNCKLYNSACSQVINKIPTATTAISG